MKEIKKVQRERKIKRQRERRKDRQKQSEKERERVRERGEGEKEREIQRGCELKIESFEEKEITQWQTFIFAEKIYFY
jgi:hypothetical protein